MNIRNFLCLLSCLFLFSCASKGVQEGSIVALQITDREGFSQNFSVKERLRSYQNIDFLEPQSFQRALRVFAHKEGHQKPACLTSYHSSGHLYQYLEILNSQAKGWYREYFPSGKLHLEAKILSGKADFDEASQASWAFDESCRVWDEESVLRAHYPYLNGLLEGELETYFPDGTIETRYSYRKGLREGIAMEYFPSERNKQLRAKSVYSHGEKEGKSFLYFPEGALAAEEFFHKGLLHSAFYYDRSGVILHQIQEGDGFARREQLKGKHLEDQKEGEYALIEYRGGQIEGKQSFYDASDNLYHSFIIKNDQKHGEEWIYHRSLLGKSSTNPFLLIHWYEGRVHGQTKTWYPDAQLKSQQEMAENQKNGFSMAWYRDASLMLLEEYKDDLLIKGEYYALGEEIPVSEVKKGKGTASFYDDDGSFLRRVYYDEGRPQP